MSKLHSFEELKCWQTARELVTLVYQITAMEKISRDFGTKDQIRRASVSVMNNIAEGFGRETQKEFIRFLDIAHGSCLEVKSMTYILEDLNYISESELTLLRDKTDRARGLTRGLIKYLKEHPR